MDKRGFTLIELLIVIGIIGILAAVAVTSYVGSIKKAARSEAYSNLQSLRLLEEQVMAENAIYFPDPGRGHINPTVGASNIQAIIPGFQPGGNPAVLPNFGLSYTYNIMQGLVRITNTAGNTTDAQPTFGPSLTPCFVAWAVGVTGTRVCPNGPGPNCDFFAIDCFNTRNF